MVNQQLTHPRSIVVVGASNHVGKPGGKLFYSIKNGSFQGELYALNPKEDQIQGLPSFNRIDQLPETDLAILAIPATLCLEAVRELAATKKTRAFIIVSAGFSEENEAGARIEKDIVEVCRAYDAALIGPNCIGVMTPAYQGVFTLPIPRLEAGGCDFISGSGATAVFIMEAGLQKGLSFNHVFSVGNSALMGVEDVLAWLDESHVEGESSTVKMLYFESIKKPQLLLKHASSLIAKGCKIAAIKAGTSDAGSRAASSHTGAIASSDVAVDALFRKAGIVRCYGREDLTTVASVMQMPDLNGRNLAIITHAGGPAVMLTDALAKWKLDVPHLEGPRAEELLSQLFPGSSAANPIDMLATGTAEQLGVSIDYCEHHFPQIDGIVVIFGTPGLAPVFDVYELLHHKMLQCSKPIYPVLPSTNTAKEEVAEFLSRGHLNFPDEVELGEALGRILNTPPPCGYSPRMEATRSEKLHALLEEAGEAYLDPGQVGALLDLAGIARVREVVLDREDRLLPSAAEVGYPLVMKVVGPVHKSDVGGVSLDISDDRRLEEEYHRMMHIPEARGVLLQSMATGLELFAGAKREDGFGHVLLCGMGGVMVEVLKDVAAGLCPLGEEEALRMIGSLKSLPLLQGYRGKEGISIPAYARLLQQLSQLLERVPEIEELDLNPILGKGENLVVVDARIRLGKQL